MFETRPRSAGPLTAGAPLSSYDETSSYQLGEASAFTGRYRIVAALRSGGASNVYLGVEHGSQRAVVIKTPRPGFMDDEDLVRAFWREARLAARLRHPNIVETYEVLDEAGAPAIVMEYLDGASLQELRRAAQTDGLAMNVQLCIVRDACTGLHYCHEVAGMDGKPLGLVHRDVTPHNIFVTAEGGVKLLDFGIAKLSGKDSDTRTGVIKGKLRYMSPEQMHGAAVDRRTDVWAVGVMLWESISGRSMWEGVSDALIMARTVAGEVPALAPRGPGVRGQLLELTRSCLELRAEDRPASAAEVSRLLDLELARLPAVDPPIGDQVAELFATRRTRNAELLSPPPSWTSPARSHPIDLGIPTLIAGGSSFRSSQPHLVQTTVPDAPVIRVPEDDPRPASLVSRARSGLVLAAFLGLAGLSWTWFAPRVTSSAPSTIHVAIRVDADQDVDVRLDGRTLAPPYELDVPPDDAPHLLTVQGEDAQMVTRTLLFGRDVMVDIVLPSTRAARPVGPSVPPPPSGRTLSVHSASVVPPLGREAKSTPPAPPPTRRPSKRKARSTAPVLRQLSPAPPASKPATTPTAAPDCDPPFTVDAEGVKRFKRECL